MGPFYGNTRKLSYEPGETLEIRITASDLTYIPYTLEIFRIGPTNERVWQSQNLTLVGENYFTLLALPSTWKSGYYQIRRAGENGQHNEPDHGEMFFVVRSATGQRARILLVLSTNTYYAYNYPGPGNFYDEPRQFELSFERHLKRDHRPAQTNWIPNAGYWPRFEGSFYSWEWPFIRWAEPLYSIDYAINSDLEFHPEILSPPDPRDKYALVLSVGHDEYWSMGMRNNLEAFIRSGGNVAFLSGNVCCWQVRWGDEGRTMICYRDLQLSEHPEIERQDLSLLTMLWCHPLVRQPPENTLTGVGLRWSGNFPPRYEPGPPPQPNPSPALYPSEYTVYRPEHWVFAGCDLNLLGNKFGKQYGIVGYECDGCDVRWVDGLPFPTTEDGTPKDFEILALSPLAKVEVGIITPGSPSEWKCLTHDDPKGVVYNLQRRGHATLGLYVNGGTVFTVGSTDWSLALSPHDGSLGDRTVQQITRNVINALGGTDMAWRLVFEHDANGGPVLGNLNDLLGAVEKGADVRVMTADGNIKVAFIAEFVWIINGVVYAQNNQNISVDIQAPAGGTQVMFSDESYHSFVMVNTNGYRDDTRWLVGDHIARGHTQDRVGVKWFVR